MYKMNFNFDDAWKIAYEYYEISWGVKGISKIKDLGEKWFFYPKETEPFFGGSHITISKYDGKIDEFSLPNEKNFQLLKEATNVEVPNEYKE